jgi:hypothetical protein
MYAIICKARSGKDKGVRILALVDRKKTRRLWWTSDNIAHIQTFDTLHEAETRAGRLTQNSVRVLPYEKVCNKIRAQNQRILAAQESRDRIQDDRDCLDAVELGWDAHKAW